MTPGSAPQRRAWGNCGQVAGPSQQTIDNLKSEFHQFKYWPEKNLFFGGAHCVMRDREGHSIAKGDSRRGGISLEH